MHKLKSHTPIPFCLRQLFTRTRIAYPVVVLDEDSGLKHGASFCVLAGMPGSC